jgi:hypothetical protein
MDIQCSQPNLSALIKEELAALFYRQYKKAKDWHIEGRVKTFGRNVIGATLVVSGGSWQRGSIIGAYYIHPSKEDGKTLECIELAAHRMWSNPPILLGDLNVDHQYVRRRTTFPKPICPKDGGRDGGKMMEELCKASKELDKKKNRKTRLGSCARRRKQDVLD